MTLLKNLIVLGLIGCFLAACADSAPQPKKPKWAEQSSENLFNN